MNKFFYYLLLIVNFNLIIFNCCFAQDKEKLKRDKEKLQQEINYTNELIKQTKKKTQISSNQLVLLNKQIEKRKKLIQTIQEEIKETENDINLANKDIKTLSNNLESLKKEYSKMVIAANKNRSFYNRLMFIFSASDFNQAYRRMKYIQQFNFNLKKQAENIEKTQGKLKHTVSELSNYKINKETLKINNEVEKQQLVGEKQQQGKSLKELQKKQKELQKTLKEKELAAAELQRRIEAVINKEINESSSKKDVVKSSNPAKFSLTPEEQKLSNTFSGNRGKLPWPTAKGIISSSFGEHAHPVLKNIIIKNNGIDISTENNAEARAIFEGKVTAVISVPGADKAIIIRHGDYLSVYSNLADVYINKGDKITTKQKIGKIATDTSDSKTELHFELWRGKSLLNPTDWLAR